MPAARRGAPRPGKKPVDDQSLPPAMTTGAEPGPNAVARHREGHEHRLTPVLRDAVTARADPLYGQLDEAVAACLRLPSPGIMAAAQMCSTALPRKSRSIRRRAMAPISP